MLGKIGAMVAGSPTMDLWGRGEVKVEGQRAVPMFDGDRRGGSTLVAVDAEPACDQEPFEELDQGSGTASTYQHIIRLNTSAYVGRHVPLRCFVTSSAGSRPQ